MFAGGYRSRKPMMYTCWFKPAGFGAAEQKAYVGYVVAALAVSVEIARKLESASKSSKIIENADLLKALVFLKFKF
jgi:hypothetical protein